MQYRKKQRGRKIAAYTRRCGGSNIGVKWAKMPKTQCLWGEIVLKTLLWGLPASFNLENDKVCFLAET